MRLLLDSHIFLWAKTAPENLADSVRAQIIDPANDVFVSIASAWELWLKHAKKPIAAAAPMLERPASFISACRESGFALLEIRLEHAAAAASLPRIHRDPFDRMLIAQAIVEDLSAVTDDPAFRNYKGLQVLSSKRSNR
jgi:PIN domain nuclease of toxin-antitoxin system